MLHVEVHLQAEGQGRVQKEVDLTQKSQWAVAGACVRVCWGCLCETRCWPAGLRGVGLLRQRSQGVVVGGVRSQGGSRGLPAAHQSHCSAQAEIDEERSCLEVSVVCHEQSWFAYKRTSTICFQRLKRKIQGLMQNIKGYCCVCAGGCHRLFSCLNSFAAQ